MSTATVAAVPTRRITRQELGIMPPNTRVFILEGPEASSPGFYWMAPNRGITHDRGDAYVYTAVDAYSATIPGYEYELVDQPAPPLEPPPPADPTKPIPIRLTYRQISQNMAGIETKMCRTVCGVRYIRKPYPNGLTSDVENAHVSNVRNALEMFGSSGDYSYELLDQEEALRISQLPVKMCIITEALSSALIDSLRLHPNHPVYRSLVLAALLKAPPPELTTFDEVVNWIESNCEAKNKVRNEQPVRNAQPPTNTLEIRLSFSDTESGTCRYTVDRYGSGTYRFRAEDLASMAEDVENLDELVESIEETISDNAHDVQEDMEWSDDGPDYDHTEATDHDNEEWEYRDGADTRRARLMEFLQRNLSVEQRERLGITAP